MSAPALSTQFQPEQPRPDRELMRTLYTSGPAGLAVQVMGALVLVATLLPQPPAGRVAAWLVLFVAASAWRWAVLRRYRALLQPTPPSGGEQAAAARPDPVPAVRGRLGSARREWDITVMVGALVWSIGVVMFYPTANTPQQLALTLLSCSVCVAQPVSRYGAYVVCALLGFGSVAACVMWQQGPHHVAVVAVLCLALVIVLTVAWRYRTSFHEMFVLQAQARRLAGQLWVEKQAAERSRQLAEEAAQLRTRFFTAASHDLRQPLHGLGLFVQALKSQQLPDDAQAMVQRAADSIDALEAMFDELLDFSRIEQGRDAPHSRPLPLAPLCQRVARDLDPIAFDKGLTLAFRGMHRWAFADEAMLERILRNLVVNALRYTDDGGVLVTCRPRGGSLALQVWDTGRGVAPEVLPRIFDAYYQGEPVRGFGTGRMQGLGMGLAIARGLADAMGMSLSVRSQAGRGSVFTLIVPCGSQASAGPPLAPMLTLAGRRIVVVTPHAEEGLSVANLLRTWAAQVALHGQAPAVPGRTDEPAPDLLIVAEESLPVPPAARTAPALAAALRGVWHAAVPTVVLTSDRALAAAVALDAPSPRVLMRPVQPARLRSLVAYLLAQRTVERPLK